LAEKAKNGRAGTRPRIPTYTESVPFTEMCEWGESSTAGRIASLRLAFIATLFFYRIA